MKRKHPIRRAILLTLAYLLGTICLAVVSYALFSLFFNTAAEERLSSEISMYERIYPSLEQKEETCFVSILEVLAIAAFSAMEKDSKRK